MLVELDYESWFKFKTHVLSELILIKLCVSSTEKVFRVFVVVFPKVSKQFWSHMSMIWTWSDAWE